MPKYRSATTTHGRNMAGARALWRATGMTDADFGKPIIAVVNSFTQFVPGHVHLRDLGVGEVQHLAQHVSRGLLRGERGEHHIKRLAEAVLLQHGPFDAAVIHHYLRQPRAYVALAPTALRPERVQRKPRCHHAEVGAR